MRPNVIGSNNFRSPTRCGWLQVAQGGAQGHRSARSAPYGVHFVRWARPADGDGIAPCGGGPPNSPERTVLKVDPTSGGDVCERQHLVEVVDACCEPGGGP